MSAFKKCFGDVMGLKLQDFDSGALCFEGCGPDATATFGALSPGSQQETSEGQGKGSAA